jgi:hypothetical protein
MTTDIFCMYIQNRVIQTGQRGGQQYSDTSPFSIPWFLVSVLPLERGRECRSRERAEGTESTERSGGKVKKRFLFFTDKEAK